MASDVMAAARKVFNANKRGGEKKALMMATEKWAELLEADDAVIFNMIYTEKHGVMGTKIAYRYTDCEYDDDECDCISLYVEQNRYKVRFLQRDYHCHTCRM